MTTAAVTSENRIHRTDRWTVLLVVGIVDALAGLAGVELAAGSLRTASWVLLVAGVDLALFAAWRARRTS